MTSTCSLGTISMLRRVSLLSLGILLLLTGLSTRAIAWQTAQDCDSQFGIGSFFAPAAGGGGAGILFWLGPIASPGCTWTVSTANSWITFVGATSGVAIGTPPSASYPLIQYQFAANTSGAAREGSISVEIDGVLTEGVNRIV
jgi:hypothetical protein